MKKLERRAIICLALAFVLLAGICYYVFLVWTEGGKWISLPSNQHIYKGGTSLRVQYMTETGLCWLRTAQKEKRYIIATGKYEGQLFM